jgi:hypothetical protein
MSYLLEYNALYSNESQSRLRGTHRLNLYGRRLSQARNQHHEKWTEDGSAMLLRNDKWLYRLRGVISRKIITGARTSNPAQFLYTFLGSCVWVHQPSSVALRPQFTNHYHLYDVWRILRPYFRSFKIFFACTTAPTQMSSNVVILFWMLEDSITNIWIRWNRLNLSILQRVLSTDYSLRYLMIVQ